MKRIDYTGAIEKIRAYGITAFYRDSGIGGKMNFVYNLEHGGNMTMKSLDELCRFFSCGVEDLIGLQDVPKAEGSADKPDVQKTEGRPKLPDGPASEGAPKPLRRESAKQRRTA